MSSITIAVFTMAGISWGGELMTRSLLIGDLLYKKTLNILLYGDSIMRGIVYNDAIKKYTVLSNAFWNILASKINATLTNAARFGNTLGRAIKKLYQDITRAKPDVVLFELGGNDCDFNWDEIAANPDAHHKPKTDFDEFQKVYEEVIKNLYSMNILPVLLTLPPIDSERYFSWISKGDPVAAKNILKWLGDVEEIYKWQAKYNKALHKVAEKTDTVIIDIREEFMKGNHSDYLCSDGIHPNEKGHRLIAKQIENFIRNKYPSILVPPSSSKH